MLLPILPAAAVFACSASDEDSSSTGGAAATDGAVLVIDATRIFDGESVIDNARMVISHGRVQAIGSREETEIPEGAEVVDHSERFIMPGMIGTHQHVGTVAGLDHGGANYSRETVARDLEQFQRYGVVVVNSLGLNRPLFYELRQEFRGAAHGGADLYGAGAGIGTPSGAPPEDGMNVVDDQVTRPQTAEEAREAVRQMAGAGVDMIKIWLDDMGGSAPKMEPEVYTAAIEEAHSHGLTAAFHIHSLEDAKAAVAAGANIIAHGVRDTDVDDEFVTMMVENNVWYIPTINLDEGEYLYAEHPEWLDDPFVTGALSEELQARIADEQWRQQAIASSDDEREAVAMNIRNLGRLHDGGVSIAMGTDAQGTAMRVAGFAEHRELELMVEAGMSPVAVLQAATARGAGLMRLEDRGRLAEGYLADFLVMDADPSQDIGATRTLREVWREGVRVVQHPASTGRSAAGQ